MTRRILELDGPKITVSAESRFETERDLHEAIAVHPLGNPGFSSWERWH